MAPPPLIKPDVELRITRITELRGGDDAVEAEADCVEKRLVAERAADQLAPVVRVPYRGDRRSAERGR
jgi:hypothetical protein